MPPHLRRHQGRPGIADAEIEDDRCGHDRNHPGKRRMTPPLRFEGTDHTVGRGETEGATAGEHDRLHVLDLHSRGEERGLCENPERHRGTRQR